MAADHGLSSIFDLLTAGDVEGICALFVSSVHLEEPFEGSIHGEEELRRFVNAIMIKIRCRNIFWEHKATIITPHRIVCEWQMNADFRNDLFAPPVAAVADVMNGKFSSIRIYYSTCPQTGKRGIRLPLLPEDKTIVLEGAVRHYQRSLAAGNLEGVLEAFEEDAIRRDPRGEGFVCRGTSQLRELYGRYFSHGGIPLRHCSVTSDGQCCAIEYICDRWGTSVMPPQAGVAVYIQGPTGRIAALRAYDDIEPSDISPIS